MINLRLFFIFALCAVGLGCDPDKKVTRQSFDLQKVTKQLDENETQLETYRLRLLGPEARTNFESTSYNFAPLTSEQITSIQSLLEDYVVIAKKLITTADNRVVVFTAAQTYEKKLKRAESYLARLYVFLPARDLTGPEIRSSWMDESEFTLRNARFAEVIDRHKKRGLDLIALEKTSSAINKYSNSQLRELVVDLEQLSKDCLRLNVLINRNRGWGVAAFGRLSKSYEAMAGVAYRVKIIIEEILKGPAKTRTQQ